MELCSVCSELDLFPHSPHRYGNQTLGSYDELVLRSQSLGPGRAGCGGCEFFSAMVQSSERWCDRIPELSDSIIILAFHGLRVKASSDTVYWPSERPDFDLELSDVVPEEGTGMLQCD